MENFKNFPSIQVTLQCKLLKRLCTSSNFQLYIKNLLSFSFNQIFLCYRVQFLREKKSTFANNLCEHFDKFAKIYASSKFQNVLIDISVAQFMRVIKSTNINLIITIFRLKPRKENTHLTCIFIFFYAHTTHTYVTSFKPNATSATLHCNRHGNAIT